MRWVLMVIVFSFAGCETPRYYSDKYRPVAGQNTPRLRPTPLRLQEQVEGHTCGYHALATIYAAHGLDSERARLRFRLGVDKAAIPMKESTRGTLHPDLFRVASQDGFQVTAIDPQDSSVSARLQAHFRRGYAALGLIKLPHSGILHWVALDSAQRGKLKIYDSIADRPYYEPMEAYLTDQILSLILLEPAQNSPSISVGKAHRDGILEMNRVLLRLGRKK